MKRECCNRYLNRHAQVTIFVIIAIVIVAAIGGYFIFTNYYNPTIPENFLPVYNSYISCANQIMSEGAGVMASQAGYLVLPEFSPGSTYAPFSNQMGFMGSAIPYWYYVSSNGITKEQIPTKTQMQNQLANYLTEEIGNRCKLDSFSEQGFAVVFGDASSAKTTIASNSISGSFSQSMVISLGDSKVSINNHKLNVNSNLGQSYDLAKQIYSYEKSSMFLENYTLDILNNYAPVTGTELGCSPKVWIPGDVFKTLQNAISSNIGAIKISGDYYNPKKTKSYFIVGAESGLDVPSGQSVSFRYSPSWPQRFEVWPTTGDTMVANPVGNQPGLSALGFCYAPYKFVYDLYFPVMVQIYNSNDAEEIFQFPISIVISKNVPRVSQTPVTDYVEPTESICEKANKEINIYSYNVNLEPVEADIKFKCLNEVCSLGKTKIVNGSNTAYLTAKVPECYNAFLIANSEKYAEKKYQISTNEESNADIVLDRQYSLNLDVYVDGVLSKDLAVLTMQENNNESLGLSQSISYPSNNLIKISEGDYNLALRVYSSKEIIIPPMTTKQCVSVPQSGVLGVLGFNEEKCTDVTIGQQKLTDVISAGGKTNYYFTPGELENKKIMRVYVSKIKVPTSTEEVALSFDAINSKLLKVEIV